MNFGNKGAICVALRFGDHVIEVINCHLKAGYSKDDMQARYTDLL